jgi:hypothetical protein
VYGRNDALAALLLDVFFLALSGMEVFGNESIHGWMGVSALY